MIPPVNVATFQMFINYRHADMNIQSKFRSRPLLECSSSDLKQTNVGFEDMITHGIKTEGNDKTAFILLAGLADEN